MAIPLLIIGGVVVGSVVYDLMGNPKTKIDKSLNEKPKVRGKKKGKENDKENDKENKDRKAIDGQHEKNEKIS